MENALYSFYSLVVLYHKIHSFAALTRSFYDTSRLMNKNRTRALSMKYSLYTQRARDRRPFGTGSFTFNRLLVLKEEKSNRMFKFQHKCLTRKQIFFCATDEK